MTTSNPNGFSALQDRLRVMLPEAYQRLVEKGWTSFDSDDYLWLPEAEWLPLDEMANPSFPRDRVIEGLLPFAQTGAGDLWAWNRNIPTDENEFEIVLCVHDQELGEVDAPNFTSWFYRRCLDYAGCIDNTPEEISESASNLNRWSYVLKKLGLESWSQHLESLSGTKPFFYEPSIGAFSNFGYITDVEIDRIVKETMGSRYLDTEIEWGWYDD